MTRRWRWVAPLAILALLIAASLRSLDAEQAPDASPSPIASPSPAASPASAGAIVFRVATPNASSAPASPAAPRGAASPDRDGQRRPVRPSGRIDDGSFQAPRTQRPNLSTRTIYDPYRLLTIEQRDTLRSDANWLRRNGMPVLVYVRISEANAVQAAEFADRLLHEWAVESSPGAADGMVVLVNMGVSARRTGDVTIRTGVHALPRQGLDEAGVARIATEEISPRLKRGQIYSGVLSGLRSFIYTISYEPEPLAPRSGGEGRVHDVLTWLAPVAGGLALIAVAGAWLEKRWAVAGIWRRAPRRLVTTLALAYCLVFAVLSVYATSRVGVAMVLLVALAVCVSFLRRPPAAPQPTPPAHRELGVMPGLRRRRRGLAPPGRTPRTTPRQPPRPSTGP